MDKKNKCRLDDFMYVHESKHPVWANSSVIHPIQPGDKGEEQSASPNSHQQHSSDSEQVLPELLQRFAEEAGIVVSDSQGRLYFPWSDLSRHCPKCKLRNWYLRQAQIKVADQE